MNTETEILIIIISSLLSGIIGVIVSVVYHRRYEKYRAKLDTLKNLVGYRNDVKGAEFSKALNEILIVFQDSMEILETLELFRKTLITQRNKNDLVNDSLLRLVKIMCRNVGVNINKINDSNFLQAFNIKRYGN